MKELKKDLLKIKVLNSALEMGAEAAKDAAQCIEKMLEKKGELNIIFAAAPSQNTFLDALKKYPVQWNKINALHMDEYIGLPAAAPQGFGNFLTSHIFGDVPFKSISYIASEGLNAEQICARYVEILKNHPVDIVFMGVGENGHIAFNDPEFAFFDDPVSVKIVELDNICRNQQVNDGCFAKLSDVPTHAITLTIPTLMSAAEIFCVVPRSTKANAVKNMYFGEIEQACPASILRTHPSATLYCDCDSASQII